MLIYCHKLIKIIKPEQKSMSLQNLPVKMMLIQSYLYIVWREETGYGHTAITVIAAIRYMEIMQRHWKFEYSINRFGFDKIHCVDCFSSKWEGKDMNDDIHQIHSKNWSITKRYHGWKGQHLLQVWIEMTILTILPEGDEY